MDILKEVINLQKMPIYLFYVVVLEKSSLHKFHKTVPLSKATSYRFFRIPPACFGIFLSQCLTFFTNNLLLRLNISHLRKCL